MTANQSIRQRLSLLEDRTQESTSIAEALRVAKEHRRGMTKEQLQAESHRRCLAAISAPDLPIGAPGSPGRFRHDLQQVLRKRAHRLMGEQAPDSATQADKSA